MVRQGKRVSIGLILALIVSAVGRSSGQDKAQADASWEACVGQARSEVERVLGYSVPRVDSVEVVENIEINPISSLSWHDTGFEPICRYLQLRFPHLDEAALSAASIDA